MSSYYVTSLSILHSWPCLLETLPFINLHDTPLPTPASLVIIPQSILWNLPFPILPTILLWMLSSDPSFSQLNCYLYNNVSEVSFLSSDKIALFWCPMGSSDSAQPKLTLSSFPKKTASHPAGGSQETADMAAHTVAQAISLGVTHSLSAPQPINHQVLSSLSLGFLSHPSSCLPLHLVQVPFISLLNGWSCLLTFCSLPPIHPPEKPKRSF